MSVIFYWIVFQSESVIREGLRVQIGEELTIQSVRCFRYGVGCHFCSVFPSSYGILFADVKEIRMMPGLIAVRTIFRLYRTIHISWRKSCLLLVSATTKVIMLLYIELRVSDSSLRSMSFPWFAQLPDLRYYVISDYSFEKLFPTSSIASVAWTYNCDPHHLRYNIFIYQFQYLC